jgi:YidC/Oxa1 family membrane protein insertase
MEKRVLVAIILSLAVLLLWQALFPTPQPKKVERIPTQGEEERVLPQEEEFSPGKSVQEEEMPSAFSTLTKEPESNNLPPEKEIVVATDLYTATFSSRGACLKNFELMHYKNKMPLPRVCTLFPFSLLYDEKGIPRTAQLMKLVENKKPDNYLLQTSFGGSDTTYPAHAPFTVNTDGLALDDINQQGEITFSWTSEEGVDLIKTFTFSNDSYYIDYDFTVENNSSTPLDIRPSVKWPSTVKQEPSKKSGGLFGARDGEIQQFIYLISDTVNRQELKDITENKVFSGDIKWAGFEEKYFISSLILHEEQDLTLQLVQPQNGEVSFQLLFPMTNISLDTHKTFSSSIYLGPKDLGQLEKGEGELGRAIDFGFFDPVAKPMLFILNLFYSFIPNYGLAIIFLSIAIKVIFWPLTHKSQKSMKEMQKIQPKIAELKEKYKDNKDELNRKTMEFYKTNKVNPLGGCLPILIQIPVFFALYRVLLNSIELRHAPFISFWINDLAAKDPTYISPLLMGASMFMQQKMTPTVGDPAQAKIMLVMPIMFTFMFLSFPSGLVIYWLVSNVLSIVQQYYINKQSS